MEITALIDSRISQGTVNNQILQWNNTTKRFVVTLAPTWGDGNSATLTHTFNLSGTSHTMTASSNKMIFSNDMEILGGELLITEAGNNIRTKLVLQVTGGGSNQDSLVVFRDAGEGVDWGVGHDDSGSVFRIARDKELAKSTAVTINSRLTFQIHNDLQVDGSTTLGDTTIQGNLEVAGTINSPGFSTGSLTLTGRSATEFQVARYYTDLVQATGAGEQFQLGLTGRPTGSGDYNVEIVEVTNPDRHTGIGLVPSVTAFAKQFIDNAPDTIILYGDTTNIIFDNDTFSITGSVSNDGNFKLASDGTYNAGNDDTTYDVDAGMTNESIADGVAAFATEEYVTTFQWQVDGGGFTGPILTQVGFFELENDVKIAFNDEFGSSAFAETDAWTFTSNDDPIVSLNVNNLTGDVDIGRDIRMVGNIHQTYPNGTFSISPRDGSGFSVPAFIGDTALANLGGIFEFYTHDDHADGSKNTWIRIFGLGSATQVVDIETLDMGWDATNSVFFMRTNKSGDGIVRPFHLYTVGNTNQLVLNADGTINTLHDFTVGNELFVGGNITIPNAGFIGSVTVPESIQLISGDVVIPVDLFISSLGPAAASGLYRNVFNQVVGIRPVTDGDWGLWNLNSGVLSPAADTSSPDVDLPGDLTMTGNLDVTGDGIGDAVIIRQGDDNDGIMLFGFGDRSSDFLAISIASSGQAIINATVSTQYQTGSTTNMVFQATNSAVHKNFTVLDNIVVQLGSGADYSLGYNSASDEFRISNGNSVASNVRLSLNSVGLFKMFNGLNIGDGTNEVRVSATGDMSFLGTATVFNDIQFSISTAKVPASNFPAWANFGANTKKFTFAVNDLVDLEANEVHHSYKEGSNLICHVHFYNNGVDGTDRTVKYQLDIGITNPGAAYSESQVSQQFTIPASTPDKTHFVLTINTFDGTGIEQGAEITIRFTRIVESSGTAPSGDPFVSMVGVHIEEDTVGSRTEIAK